MVSYGDEREAELIEMVTELRAEVERLRDSRDLLEIRALTAEAEIARLRAELAWFTDASNYYPGDLPNDREADLIREHTARARRAREG
uniref:Uncharacterized protein n=1 Tax=viral metagenome TaxID=1070528 RepID=A0A6H2A1L0_9ZZZZ